MRSLIVLAACLTAMPLRAETGVAVQSAVYVERGEGRGLAVEPAERLMRGDRVVTVLTWRAPARAGYTITSAVPAALELESASRAGITVSTDGGRTWHVLEDGRSLPAGVTHLRWSAGAGDGRLSYRARVR